MRRIFCAFLLFFAPWLIFAASTVSGSAAPLKNHPLRPFVEVTPEFPRSDCNSASLIAAMSVPAGAFEVAGGKIDQPVTIAIEVQAGPSFRLGDTVVNWIQGARGSLTLGT